MLILKFFMLMSTFLLIFMKHPISMGLIILMQTIFISLIIGMMNLNYWLPYILFLIMIGGLLILFIYMTTIASNEKFKMSKLLLMMMLIMNLIYMWMIKYDMFLSYTEMKNYNMDTIDKTMNFNMMMNKYLIYPSNLTYTMIIIYLLITLICCVKISTTFKGPMRQKN
uniref:NADH-ubiquinone oxidoreductase chain 6 n=1 Tax=Malachiinae sp. GENSP01 TaxID=1205562 RepID=A0A0S2MQK9_9CUCU|nr:NADH deshydrogenase subunit 6 [Malachiinae sp. GENSP01]